MIKRRLLTLTSSLLGLVVGTAACGGASDGSETIADASSGPEYGPAHYTYNLSGTVTSRVSGNGIPNITVACSSSDSTSATTTATGEFTINGSGFGCSQLKATDTDGEENGGRFLPATVGVTDETSLSDLQIVQHNIAIVMDPVPVDAGEAGEASAADAAED